MQKLELKHLAAYLPYLLEGITNNRVVIVDGIDYTKKLPIIWHEKENATSSFVGVCGLEFKPILRPLSDLTIECVQNNIIEGDCILIEQDIEDIISIPKGHLMYYQFGYLMKHHFDFWGLIEAGLAIDINTLNK